MIYTVQEIQDKVKTVADRYDIQKIHLFGSYFDGVPDEESDVDLIVSYGDGCHGLERISFMNDLEVQLQKSVDVLNIDFLPGFLTNFDLQQRQGLFTKRTRSKSMGRVIREYGGVKCVSVAPVSEEAELEWSNWRCDYIGLEGSLDVCVSESKYPGKKFFCFYSGDKRKKDWHLKAYCKQIAEVDDKTLVIVTENSIYKFEFAEKTRVKMSILDEVLIEEYNRCERIKQMYQEKLRALPDGHLSEDTKGKEFYLQRREGGKVVSQYVQREDVEILQKLIEERKRCQEGIKAIEFDQKKILAALDVAGIDIKDHLD